TLIPLSIGSEPRRHAMGNNFEDAADGISRSQRLIYFLLHALFYLEVRAAQQDLFTLCDLPDLFPSYFSLRQRRTAHGKNVAENLDLQLAKEGLRYSANRYARRRFAGGCTLENVACFGKIVLESTGEIGMPRTRRRHSLVFLRISIFDRQRLLPVLPVSILNHNRDRRTDSHTVPHAGKNVC